MYEILQRHDLCATWDVETTTEILEERDAELLAGFHQSEKDITGFVSVFGPGSTRDFAFSSLASDVVFGSVGVERNFRSIENTQEFILTGMEC